MAGKEEGGSLLSLAVLSGLSGLWVCVPQLVHILALIFSSHPTFIPLHTPPSLHHHPQEEYKSLTPAEQKGFTDWRYFWACVHSTFRCFRPMFACSLPCLVSVSPVPCAYPSSLFRRYSYGIHMAHSLDTLFLSPMIHTAA